MDVLRGPVDANFFCSTGFGWETKFRGALFSLAGSHYYLLSGAAAISRGAMQLTLSQEPAALPGRSGWSFSLMAGRSGFG